MNQRTAAALGRLNRAFYSRHAAEFAATRRRPWKGWERVVALVRRELPLPSLAVLDAGCGDGRFGRFLAGALETPFDYLGVDSSPELLALAGADPPRGAGDRRFLAADLLAAGALPPSTGFDLIAAFGLLHHVPGLERRRRLLAELAHRLRPRGLLAVSFWQFGDRERFRRRMIPWEEYNRTALEGAREPVDAADLEPGDHLLRWGDAESGAVRYCHWADPDEARALVEPLGLETVDSFSADGAAGELNLYFVLRSPG